MGSLPKFLKKLLEIVDEMPEDVAGWSADGREYVIYSSRFETDFLPKYFKGSRATFIRQLHFYGFRKLDNVGERWSFSHPKFLKGKPHLVYEIIRSTRPDDMGPASKDEVQALRDMVTSMSYKLSRMETVMEELKDKLLGDAYDQGVALRRKRSLELPTIDDNDNEDDQIEGPMKRQQKQHDSQPAVLGRIESFTSNDGEIGEALQDWIVGKSEGDRNQAEATSGFQIFIKSYHGDIPLPVASLADLFTRVVERSCLLSKMDAFGQEPDANLERYIHSLIPSSNPLTDLLANADPDIRLVMLHVLAEFSEFSWLSQEIAVHATEELDPAPFIHRPFIACQGEDLVEVSGGMFLMLLRCLIDSSIQYDPNAQLPDLKVRTRFFEAITPFLPQKTFRVLVYARNKLYQMVPKEKQ